MLGGLAALLVAAGVLPWVAGGSVAARGFAAPLLLVGLFAGYVVLRAVRAPSATAPAGNAAPASAGSVGPVGSGDTGCGGCQCGGGGCGAQQER
jgi:hypothetical protein